MRKPAERSAARLAAVQALYQMEVSSAGAEAVIREFSEHRFDRDIDDMTLAGADEPFFADLVRGVLTVHEFPVEGGGRSRNAELRATALGHDLRWGTSSYTDGGRRRASQAAPAVTGPGEAPTGETGRADGSGAGDWGARPEVEQPRRETVPVGPPGDWSTDETPF